MKSVKTSVAEMHIDDEGIMHVRMIKGGELTLAETKEYFEAGHLLLGDKKALVLLDASVEYAVTAAAKAYSVTEEATRNRIAVAIVTGSIANKLMFNIYMRIHKPSLPTKMFSSKEKALKWLRSFYILPGEKFIRKVKKA